MANDMEMKMKITAETDDNQIKKKGEEAGKLASQGIEKGLKNNNNIDKEAKKIGQEIGETTSKTANESMSKGFLKGMAIRETIKGVLQNLVSTIKDFFSDSIELANKYESAFAGVRKTIDGTEAEFKKLDSSLRKMAKEIPIAYEDLASIMELGGQLGIDIQNMDKFTKVIAELGVATNMTAEESAQMLAQFANITNMDLNDIDKLGSVIVALGNNFETTENDITNFASRIAGAGQIVGISQANIMAIATAFRSVGIEAEAGGTAVQKVLLNMNNAVVQGGDQLELYAKAVGITTEEFQKLFNEHPEKAFEEFVKGLSKSGKEAQLVLSELGLTDERLTRAFLSLAQKSSVLTEAIEMSNKARDDNVALMNEAEKRFATTESQLIMIQNERANLMASIGEKLQGISLTWEKIKTSVVETVAELSGVTVNPTELTDALETSISGVEERIRSLDIALAENRITLEEYGEQYEKLKNIKDGYSNALDNENDTLKNLKEQYEDAKSEYEKRLDIYKDGIEERGEGSIMISDTKDRVEEYRQKMIETQGELENYQSKQKKEAEVIQEVTRITNELTDTENQLKEMMKSLGGTTLDLSKPRAQMNETEQKAMDLMLKIVSLKAELGGTKTGIITAFNDVKTKVGGFFNTAKNLFGIKDVAQKELKETKETVSKEVKNIQDDINKTVDKTNKTKSSGGGKKSDPVAKAKEQAKQIRDEKIKALEQEELDELEKNKRLDEIYTEYKDKIIEIDGKTNDDLLKSAEDFLKEYRKNKQDEIAEEKKAGEDSIKNIEKYGKEIEKLGEKRQDYKNEAVKSLKEVNKELEDLEKENTQNLADRYLEVEKAMREIEKENYGIQYDSSSIEQLKEYQKQGMDSYYGTDIETLIEYKKLQTEIALLEENTTEETIKEAEERKNLTETEKQLLEYEEKKTQLLEKQAILQATANQGDLDSERKALIEEDGIIKYYDAEKEAYTEITDYKNQELARQLLEKQTEMESEYQLNVEQKEKEEALLQDHYDKLQKLYQSDTDIYKGELAKKEKAVRDYVEKVKAMLSEIPASHRAYGGNLLNGQVSIVGENGPEAIIARQSSYVQPRNAVQNSSTVYHNESSLSINGLEFGNFNNIDEMLIALKDKLTYRT